MVSENIERTHKSIDKFRNLSIIGHTKDTQIKKKFDLRNQKRPFS